MRKLLSRSNFAIVATAGLVLAACGSDDDDATDESVAEAEATEEDASATGDSAETADPASTELPTIVVTTSILGDVVSEVVGDAAEVVTIMPVGADPHGFQASAQEVDVMMSADALITNGGGLEESLLDVIEAAEDDGVPTFEALSAVETIEFGEDGHDHGHEGHEEGHEDEDHDHEGEEGHEDEDHDHEGEEGHDHEDEDHDHEGEEGHDHEDEDHDHEGEEGHDHEDEDHDHEGEEGHDHEDEDHDHEGEEGHDHEDEDHDHEGEEGHEDEDHDHEGEEGHDHEDEHHHHSGEDPHFWTDPMRMADAVDGIVAFLQDTVDFADSAAVEASSAAYVEELTALNGEIEAMVATVPEDDRKLVTNHQAYGYFADSFGFEQIGAVIPSGSTLDTTSGGELAELVEVIEEEEVPAVFSDNTASDELIQVLAEEAGGVIVVELYSGSLGEPGSEGATYLTMQRTNAERITGALG